MAAKSSEEMLWRIPMGLLKILGESDGDFCFGLEILQTCGVNLEFCLQICQGCVSFDVVVIMSCPCLSCGPEIPCRVSRMLEGTEETLLRST